MKLKSKTKFDKIHLLNSGKDLWEGLLIRCLDKLWLGGKYEIFFFKYIGSYALLFAFELLGRLGV
ncbi:hypothetical protein D1013_02625 [Euzebyella marina]|uniref:Uncharacterized protein n=1 Tax=Euzebyella marina TaxID=1761453 RepID=A0A3G2L288_9FLAO|nr:hypothetical protein D1013_02625 [Euzebyella marina]